MRGLLVAILVLIPALAGCSKILGIDDLSGPGMHDAATGDGARDAPADVSLANRITFSGTLVRVGLSGSPPCSGCMVELVRPDNTSAGNTTSDQTGAYQLAIPTNNMPVAGYVRVTEPSSLESHVFLRDPVIADMHLDISVYDSNVINNLALVCGLVPGGAFIAVIVEHQGARVANIAVQPGAGVPGRVVYPQAIGGVEGMPDCNTSQTSTVGVAWVINAADQTASQFNALQNGNILGSVTVVPHPSVANIVRIVY